MLVKLILRLTTYVTRLPTRSRRRVSARNQQSKQIGAGRIGQRKTFVVGQASAFLLIQYAFERAGNRRGGRTRCIVPAQLRELFESDFLSGTKRLLSYHKKKFKELIKRANEKVASSGPQQFARPPVASAIRIPSNDCRGHAFQLAAHHPAAHNASSSATASMDEYSVLPWDRGVRDNPAAAAFRRRPVQPRSDPRATAAPKLSLDNDGNLNPGLLFQFARSRAATDGSAGNSTHGFRHPRSTHRRRCSRRRSRAVSQ